MYKLGVKVVQHTSYLTKTIEVIEDIKKIDELVSNDTSPVPRNKNTLVRVRELLEFANRIPTLTDGTFLPFEHLVSWYNNDETVEGNVNVDDQRVTPDENSKSDEEIEMRMSVSDRKKEQRQ